MNWDDKAKAIEELFRNLPIKRNESATGIPYASLIKGISRQLLLMQPTNNKKPNKKPNRSNVKRSLERVASTALKAEIALENLSNTARASMDVPLRNMTLLKSLLICVHREAKRGSMTISRGRKTNLHYRRITYEVARHYYGLTHKLPTVIVNGPNAPGPFVKFLREIFSLLDVSASAESQTKILLRSETFQRLKREKK